MKRQLKIIKSKDGKFKILKKDKYYPDWVLISVHNYYESARDKLYSMTGGRRY